MPTLVNFFRNPTRYKTEGLFTPSKSGSKTEKDKRTNDKHQRKCSLSLSFGVDGP